MRVLRHEEAIGVPLRYDELTPEELAEAYRLAREAFTAADLAAYCNIDESTLIDAEDFLAELEEQQRRLDEMKHGDTK